MNTRTLRLKDEWVSEFDRTPFHFEHELANHEALSLESLREVILTLPADQVFASRADLKIDTDFDRAHKDHAIDRSLAATLADMATTNAYVMVRQPDSHPKLRPILELFMAELRANIRKNPHARSTFFAPGVSEDFHDPMLYLFISSPNSVTPFHVDRYSTLLLQLQGEKDVMIWDRHDRGTVTEEELESLFGQPYVKNPGYKGARTEEPHTAHLTKGQGVHIPFTAPHWVRNGPSVSVSISFICQTDAALRDARAYNFNYRWRRLLERIPAPLPKPPIRSVGESEIVDTTKARVYQSIAGLKRRLSGRAQA